VSLMPMSGFLSAVGVQSPARRRQVARGGFLEVEFCISLALSPCLLP